jgi:hypothetical protein
MTTPRSKAGQTAADSGSAPSPADQDAAPGLARPYADPARGYVSAGDSPQAYPDADGAASRYGYDTQLPPGWPGSADPAGSSGGPPDEPEELFPAASQAGAGWPEPDLGDEEQAAAAVAARSRGHRASRDAGAGYAGAGYAGAPYAGAAYAGAGYGDPYADDGDDAYPGGAAYPGSADPGRGGGDAEGTGLDGSGSDSSGSGGSGSGGSGSGSTEQAGASIMRSSGVMAIGTLASRGTGLLRTLVQAYALGAATCRLHSTTPTRCPMSSTTWSSAGS